MSTLVNASSLHPGGVNVLFMDGSVHFIKSSVGLSAVVCHRDSGLWRSGQLRRHFLGHEVSFEAIANNPVRRRLGLHRITGPDRMESHTFQLRSYRPVALIHAVISVFASSTPSTICDGNRGAAKQRSYVARSFSRLDYAEPAEPYFRRAGGWPRVTNSFEPMAWPRASSPRRHPCLSRDSAGIARQLLALRRLAAVELAQHNTRRGS